MIEFPQNRENNREDRGYGKPPKEHQFRPGKSGNPGGRPKVREYRERIQNFLESEAYLKSAEQRILAGKAPHLETLYHHQGFGKPTEKLDINDGRRFTVVHRKYRPGHDPLQDEGGSDEDESYPLQGE